MRHFLFLLFILFPLAAHATAPEWKIDTANSSISFDETQSGQPFTGGFKKFDGKIAFDAAHLDQSHAAITIDIHSIQVGGEGDEYISMPEWFDAAKFPTATFETNSFTKTGPNQFIAYGKLTIRDVTLPVDLPFTLTFAPDSKTVKMQATLTLNRLDYHLGTGSWADPKTVGIRVPVRISLAANKVL